MIFFTHLQNAIINCVSGDEYKGVQGCCFKLIHNMKQIDSLCDSNCFTL